MSGKMKQASAALLCGLLLLMALPWGGAAEMTSGNFVYSVLEDGTAAILRYTGSQEEVQVNWNLDGHRVTEIGESAFSGNHTLRVVTLPITLRVIGNRAFQDCPNLAEISLPERLEVIGSEVFLGCASLKTLNIPDAVTEIGPNCFDTDVTLTGSENSLAAAYAKASSLIYDEKAANAAPTSAPEREDYQYIISNGVATITSYIGTDFTVSVPAELGGCPVRTIGENAFASRYEIEEVILPEGLTDLADNAFMKCSGLMSVSLPSTLRTIGNHAFFNCTALESIVIPEGVTSLGARVFQGCSRLHYVTLPASLHSIPYYCFFECHERLVISAPSGSAAENFAYTKGYQFQETR